MTFKKPGLRVIGKLPRPKLCMHGRTAKTRVSAFRSPQLRPWSAAATLGNVLTSDAQLSFPVFSPFLRFLGLQLLVVGFFLFLECEKQPKQNQADLIGPSGSAAGASEKIHSNSAVEEQIFSHSYHLSSLIILGHCQISVPKRYFCTLASLPSSRGFLQVSLEKVTFALIERKKKKKSS